LLLCQFDPERTLERGDAIQSLGFGAGVNEAVTLLAHKEQPLPLCAQLFGLDLSPFACSECRVGFHGLFFGALLFVLSVALRLRETASRGGQRE